MAAILNAPRYTMREVARLLNVHVATVWRWSLRGVRGRRLTTVLIGGRRFVRAADLDAFVSAGSDCCATDAADLVQRADDAGRILDARGVELPTSRANHKTN